MLHWVVKEGRREKVIFGQNPEGGKKNKPREYVQVENSRLRSQ